MPAKQRYIRVHTKMTDVGMLRGKPTIQLILIFSAESFLQSSLHCLIREPAMQSCCIRLLFYSLSFIQNLSYLAYIQRVRAFFVRHYLTLSKKLTNCPNPLCTAHKYARKWNIIAINWRLEIISNAFQASNSFCSSSDLAAVNLTDKHTCLQKYLFWNLHMKLSWAWAYFNQNLTNTDDVIKVTKLNFWFFTGLTIAK